MKSRNTLIANHLSIKKSVPETSIELERIARNKRKQPTQTFFQKSAKLLQNYKIFESPPRSQDAETHFKSSLRNYSDIDFKCFKLGNGRYSINSRKSTEFLLDKRRTIRSAVAHASGDKKLLSQRSHSRLNTPKAQLNLSIEQTRYKVIDTSNTDQELEDLDVFYSPKGHIEEDFEVNNKSIKFDSNLYIIPQEELNEKDLEESEEIQETEDKITDDSGISGVEEITMAEDSDLADMDNLLQQAEEEIDSVVKENALDTGNETDATDATEPSFAVQAHGDVMPTSGTYNEDEHFSIIKELEAAEKEAVQTAKYINELKERVAFLLSKSEISQSESKELEDKNRQLKDQMSLFEEKTKRIQYLVDEANLMENISPKRQKEDVLPKVIVCGFTDTIMPKILICDDKKRPVIPGMPCPPIVAGIPCEPTTMPCQPCTRQQLPPVDVMPQFAKKLSESYSMQEKLAQENADLETKRYQLQEDLLSKEQALENLQRKVNTLQNELSVVCKENTLLSDKLNNQPQPSCPLTQIRGVPCGETYENSSKSTSRGVTPTDTPRPLMQCAKAKGVCPADVESRLQEYSQNNQQLEKQLRDMENEVRVMQTELSAVQRERQHLEHHRRHISQNSSQCLPGCGRPAPSPCCGQPPPMPSPCFPAPPCAPAPCAPPPCGAGSCPPPPCGPDAATLNLQLRELKEQYCRLQDDFKSKLTEVAGLRADVDKFKASAISCEEAKKAIEDKFKECERELKRFKLENNKFMGSKEQLMEQEQQLAVAKQRFREAQDELEETRALIQDQHEQLDDYRNKYLQAQQTVEEQRREIDKMELENNRLSEEINLEFMRMKNQFQEKLQELMPLPDLLKVTQLKLQEAQQMHLLAEKNNESLAQELEMYRDQAEAIKNQMDQVRSDQQLGEDEKESLAQQLLEWENKYNELLDEYDRLRTELEQAEDKADDAEKRAKEKIHEIVQLEAQLETVREESARQVSRIKDRCEVVRRSMQNQITDLERQLAQSRAQASSAQKERDEIRQKMQIQINNLNENFEDAQMRIRNLQGHMNYLQNSYNNMFTPNELHIPMPTPDPCSCSVKM